MNTEQWDRRYLAHAALIAQASKDPSTKVGAKIVDEDFRPVSEGYNGLPQRIRDTSERWEDRERKYKIVLHAERNALIFAQRSLKGCTLYTHPFLPCAACASMFIQAKIARVVSLHSDNPRWAAEHELALELFEEAGVTVTLYGGPVC